MSPDPGSRTPCAISRGRLRFGTVRRRGSSALALTDSHGISERLRRLILGSGKPAPSTAECPASVLLYRTDVCVPARDLMTVIPPPGCDGQLLRVATENVLGQQWVTRNQLRLAIVHGISVTTRPYRGRPPAFTRAKFRAPPCLARAERITRVRTAASQHQGGGPGCSPAPGRPSCCGSSR